MVIRTAVWALWGETLTEEDGNINLDNEVLGIIRLLSDRMNSSRDGILTIPLGNQSPDGGAHITILYYGSSIPFTRSKYLSLKGLSVNSASFAQILE